MGKPTEYKESLISTADMLLGHNYELIKSTESKKGERISQGVTEEMVFNLTERISQLITDNEKIKSVYDEVKENPTDESVEVLESSLY